MKTPTRLATPCVIALGPRRVLRPRRAYPTARIVPLHSGPLRKLAWVFGFGRRA